MSVKETAAGLLRRRGRSPSLPDTPRVALAMAAMPKGTAAVALRPPPDLDEIAERLRKQLATSHMPSLRDLRFGADCIWGARPPLGADPRILQHYLAVVQRAPHRKILGRLATAWLQNFSDDTATAQVARLLASSPAPLGIPWDTAQGALGLFDPDQGPYRVAAMALETRTSPTGILERHGIRGLSGEGGFARAACLQGLKHLEERQRQIGRPMIAEIRAWTERSDGSLVFDDLRRPLVEAAVLPWMMNNPAKKIREQILAYLLGRFKDPRLQPQNWRDVEDSPALEIIRRWLVDASLQQFLGVVDESTSVKHQWMYRRAFWEAVHRDGLISDAWVIFDQIGADEAKRVFGKSRIYGRWRDKMDPGHACLLMRVGDGLVAEWSHNGRCHLWFDANDDSAPRLHRDWYFKDDARHPTRLSSSGNWEGAHGAWVTHAGAPSYHWQGRIVTLLYRMTGHRISASGFKVSP